VAPIEQVRAESLRGVFQGVIRFQVVTAWARPVSQIHGQSSATDLQSIDHSVHGLGKFIADYQHLKRPGKTGLHTANIVQQVGASTSGQHGRLAGLSMEPIHARIVQPTSTSRA
jgi:hypothetical protein